MADFLGSLAQAARAAKYSRDKQLEEEDLAFQREQREQTRKKWAIDEQLLPLQLAEKKREIEKAKIDDERATAAYEKENFRPLRLQEIDTQNQITPNVQETTQALIAGSGMPAGISQAIGVTQPQIQSGMQAGPVPGTRTERDVPLSMEMKQNQELQKGQREWAMKNLEFLQKQELAKENNRQAMLRTLVGRRGGGGAGTSAGGSKKSRTDPGMPFTGVTGQQKFSLPLGGTFPGGIPTPNMPVDVPVINTANVKGNMLTIPNQGNMPFETFIKLPPAQFNEIMQQFKEVIPSLWVKAWEGEQAKQASKQKGNAGRTLGKDEAAIYKKYAPLVASKEMTQEEALAQAQEEINFLRRGSAPPAGPSGQNYFNKIAPNLELFFKQQSQSQFPAPPAIDMPQKKMNNYLRGFSNVATEFKY